MRAVQAIVAVLVAVATMAIVFAIKRGAEGWLVGADTTVLGLVEIVVLGPIVAWWLWTFLLRPLIERRKQRQQAGLRQSVEGDRPRD